MNFMWCFICSPLLLHSIPLSKQTHKFHSIWSFWFVSVKLCVTLPSYMCACFSHVISYISRLIFFLLLRNFLLLLLLFGWRRPFLGAIFSFDRRKKIQQHLLSLTLFRIISCHKLIYITSLHEVEANAKHNDANSYHIGNKMQASHICERKQTEQVKRIEKWRRI